MKKDFTPEEIEGFESGENMEFLYSIYKNAYEPDRILDVRKILTEDKDTLFHITPDINKNGIGLIGFEVDSIMEDLVSFRIKSTENGNFSIENSFPTITVLGSGKGALNKFDFIAIRDYKSAGYIVSFKDIDVLVSDGGNFVRIIHPEGHEDIRLVDRILILYKNGKYVFGPASAF